MCRKEAGGGRNRAWESMSHRIARVSHLVRDVVSDAIAHRVWDPRVSHFTSVTRVEVSSNLRAAAVYVSVMGTDAEAKKTMQGLESARGMIQTRLARRLNTRQCPILRFHLDKGLKVAIETIRRIDQKEADGPQGPTGSDEGAGRSLAGPEKTDLEGGHSDPSSNT